MKDKILEFLKDHQIMTLATVGVDNKPQCSVLLYVVDDRFNIYFATDDSSRKSKNLQSNPNVELCIWDTHSQSLQIAGTVSIVTDQFDINEILNKLAEAVVKEDSNLIPPVIRITREPNTKIFKITIKTIRHLDLTNMHFKESESPMTLINF